MRKRKATRAIVTQIPLAVSVGVDLNEYVEEYGWGLRIKEFRPLGRPPS